jgi:hypothetical protein
MTGLTDAERELVRQITDSYNDHVGDVERAYQIVESILSERIRALEAERDAANTRSEQYRLMATNHANASQGFRDDRDAALARVRVLEDGIRALADKWLIQGITCQCGHSIGGEHNGVGCYARITYDPLVTCTCKLTDDQFESDIAESALRALLEGKDA